MPSTAEIMKKFIERIGLPPAEFTNGLLSIQFDELVLNFYDNPEMETLDLFLVLGPVPGNEQERIALYRRLLTANAFSRLTGGATLGVDEDEEQVLFSRSFDSYGLSPEWLEFAVQGFLTRAEALQKDVLPPRGDDPKAGRQFDAGAVGGIRA